MSFETGEAPQKQEVLKYPLKPLQQSWIVDYPMLAYKCMSPDNKEIALVHLAQEMPQRLIHLGQWEFISFVHGGNERS